MVMERFRIELFRIESKGFKDRTKRESVCERRGDWIRV